MAIKRLQNKVAESRSALPLTAVYALVMCLVSGLLEQQLWWQFGILALSTFLMMELNNMNALIRIYSRMVSCSYLALAIMAKLMLASVPRGVVQLCLIVFFVFAFMAYQNKRAMGLVFYAFVAIGIASTVFVQVLYFLPVLWVLLFTNILAGGLHTFCASLLGVLMPYWFVGGYYVYTDNLDALYGMMSGLWQLGAVCDFSVLDSHQIITAAFVLLLAMVGIVHFHRNSYKDKIRTRMLFEVFAILDLCTVVFLILQPQHCDYLLGMMIVCTSPFIGHYVSLTNTRITNASFVVFLLAMLGITVYNIWM